jgi:hypothetical protein
MASRQQIPISKKVVIPSAVPALTQEQGEESMVFISQLGEAYVFPLEGKKQDIIKMLTGGVEVAAPPKLLVPPGSGA